MVSEGWISALARRGAALGEAARVDRTARLARAASLAFDGEIDAQALDEGVRLRGTALAQRVFGSRRRGPDPRLAWLAAWLAMGGY